MASPQVPPQVPFDPRYYRRYRRRSLAGPVILIGVGVCFLLANMHIISASRIGWLFATWWPLLLILLGVIRIVEYAIARSEGGPAPRLGGGAVALLVVFVVLGLSASSARHWNWQAIGDNVDVNPGWDEVFGQKYEFTQELSQPLTAGSSIQIDSDHGSITVHAGETADAPVKMVVHRRIAAESQDAANKFNGQQKPAMTMDGNILRINSGEHAPRAQIGFAMGPRVVSDLEIWAPAKAPLQITTAHGDVNVSQRGADVKISTTHGDVQVNDVKGNVDSTSHKGDIRISQITGDVHLDGRADDVTLSDISGVVLLEGEFFGDTKLSHIGRSVKFHSTRTDMELGKLSGDLEMDSGDLRATSVSGSFLVRTRAKDIRLEDISGPITVENSHGEIELHPKSPFGDVNVSNHQGAIHVVLPENAGFTVVARSSRGEFETDFPLNETKTGDDHVVQGNVGKGGSRLQLTTDHGTIEIRKG
ncbi:MAG: DUF4097 family beta strand repeat-containing protein [Terriglobales bacterium]